MSEVVGIDSQAPAAPRPTRLPPGPRMPKALQTIESALAWLPMVRRLGRRYPGAFTMNMVLSGGTVVVTDPELAKQVFTAGPDELHDIQPNLSRVLGPGSVFALDGDDHRQRRQLLTPAFHGKNVRRYEQIINEETLRETATWPDGVEFETLPAMMRLTLNVILRAVFGADGENLDDLRRIIPPWVTLGSRLVWFPMPKEPKHTFGRYSPWGRLAAWRRQYEVIIDRLVDLARTDLHLDERSDVLAMLLRSRSDGGAAMSRSDLGDELLTLLAAGHETTASTLAWVFERLTRHPNLLTELSRLSADADGAAGKELRQAVIREVQRSRTVIAYAGRRVNAPAFELGEWLIPRGFSIVIAISEVHADPIAFPDPDRFDPQRFIGAKAPVDGWIPFGGGTRRCPGATFANMEMNVVLRTVLQDFTIDTTSAPGEKYHARGVAYTPKKGGRITVHRRVPGVA